MAIGPSPPAGPSLAANRFWLSHLGRAGIAGVCLLLWYAAGQPAAAVAAGDKAGSAAAGKDDAAEPDMSDSDHEPEEESKPGFQLERVKEIVLWNEHNGKHHDSGTQTCNLSLLLDGKTVWEHNDLEIPWERNKSANRVIPVPNVKADTVRVEITAWNEKGGGLSEVEVLDKTGTNLGFGGTVKVSAERAGEQLGGDALIDGDYYSPDAEVGYWLLPEGQLGSAEIQLVPQKVPPPAADRKEMKKGKKKLSRTPMSAELFVACEESFDLYINGEHTLSGHGARLFSRHISIANGDVVAVKCEGSAKNGGFCIKILFPSGHYLSTWSNWQVFTPPNPDTWYEPDRIKPNGPITKGTGWAEGFLKDETGKKKLPIPQIWGTGKTSYLAMKADTSVKKIKLKPGQKKR
jgi:hypothetical protein